MSLLGLGWAKDADKRAVAPAALMGHVAVYCRQAEALAPDNHTEARRHFLNVVDLTRPASFVGARLSKEASSLTPQDVKSFDREVSEAAYALLRDFGNHLEIAVKWTFQRHRTELDPNGRDYLRDRQRHQVLTEGEQEFCSSIIDDVQEQMPEPIDSTINVNTRLSSCTQSVWCGSLKTDRATAASVMAHLDSQQRRLLGKHCVMQVKGPWPIFSADLNLLINSRGAN